MPPEQRLAELGIVLPAVPPLDGPRLKRVVVQAGIRVRVRRRRRRRERAGLRGLRRLDRGGGRRGPHDRPPPLHGAPRGAGLPRPRRALGEDPRARALGAGVRRPARAVLPMGTREATRKLWAASVAASALEFERQSGWPSSPAGWPSRSRRSSPLPELTEYRERFPILASTTYLINHSLGAMPAEAERRLEQFAREWKTRGARAWGEGWWESAVRVGDLIGSIIGAPPGSTVMHQNVTIAEAIVLSCFDSLKPPRNRIVFEEGLFPSVRYVQQAWSRFGAEVVVCERRRRGDRRDRRAHAARSGLPRPLQDRRDSADRADRRARATSAPTSASTPTSRRARFRST